MSKWTEFWDMHSGGSQKLDWAMIYIEAPEEEAKSVFYSRFGDSPERVSCTCCGEDYSIIESETLDQATGYRRNCKYDRGKKMYVEEDNDDYVKYGGDVKKVIPLEDYLKTVKVIYAKDIKPEERKADVPEQGYVWQD